MWNCSGASVRGTLHIETGIPCQDYCTISARLPGRRVIAISDGAGSARFSETGSRLAAETLAECLLAWPKDLSDVTRDDAQQFGALVHERLLEESRRNNHLLKDYACTVLGAAFEGDQTIFWQIGDGSWIVKTDSSVECATQPYKGEFANETAFITETDWADSSREEKNLRWQFAHYNDVNAAIGFTDGLEIFSLDPATSSPHLPFVGKIFDSLSNDSTEMDTLERLLALLRSPLITDREDDDLTLAIAWKTDDGTDG